MRSVFDYGTYVPLVAKKKNENDKEQMKKAKEKYLGNRKEMAGECEEIP